jgi:hypothetical protein
MITLIEFQADSQQRSIALGAIEANVPFYNFNGYASVGSTLIGDNDPTWDKDPIVYHVVCLISITFFCKIN